MNKKIKELINKKNNIFITGQAGVGKSYSINKIIEELDETGLEVAITSSTGISALQIGGTTAHKFFGSAIHSDPIDLPSITGTFFWKYTVKRIKEVDVIIIDEISMVTASLFNLWDIIARTATGIMDEPFGGKQIILSGDFMQLPPVVKTGLQEKDWVFNSRAWKELNIQNVVLSEVKRQDDLEFINHLGKIRLGLQDEETINYFSNIANKDIVEDITLLVSTNNEAYSINAHKLAKIDNEEISYKSVIKGKEKDREALIKEVIVDEIINLKVGAKVMTTINDSDGEYVNGSIGKVVSLNQNYVKVQWEDGRISSIKPYKWEKTDAKRNVIGEFTQMPIKLAWAITIHKSQGMSLDELHVDCGRIFAEGQMYVSLSRAKTAHRLYLSNFNANKILTSDIAKNFYLGNNEETQDTKGEEIMNEEIQTNTINNKWKNEVSLSDTKKIEDIIKEIESSSSKVIGIDTETTGLDPIKNKPFDIIIGWKDNNVFKHYNIIVDSVVQDKKELTKEESTNVKKLLDYLQDKPKVFHNSKFDIEMLMNVYPEYDITKFNDTMIMVKHIEKHLKEKQSVKLKALVDYYNIRSTLPELDPIKDAYKRATNNIEKGKAIRDNLSIIPQSKPLMNNLNKLEKDIDTEYFDMLLFKPEELMKFYFKLQTKDIEDQFNDMFPNWDMSIQDTYKYITDVYNTGSVYEEARLKLRKFNTEVLGFKDEWATIFKTGSTYNFPDYKKVMSQDKAAILIYAGMDVKITLDLFEKLVQKTKEYGFTKERMNIIKQDIDVIKPIIEQERTGFYIDNAYVEESIGKTKKMLREVNDTIMQSFEYISQGEDWRSFLEVKEGVDIKANDYRKYVKFFDKYIPYLKLPLHKNSKDVIKIDTTTKLVDLYKKWNSNDTELLDALVKLNSNVVFGALVGKENIEGMIYRVYSEMIEGAKTIVQQRNEEIMAGGLKADGTPKLKLRKEERELNELIPNLPEDPSIGILMIKDISTNVNKIGNNIIKKQAINIHNVTRTINKKNMHEMKRLDIDKFTKELEENGKILTQKEISNIHEVKKILDLKQFEASALKWIGVYMIKLLGQRSISQDDRIRTSYMVAGPVTGRLSGDIQQFPKKPLKNMFTGEVVYHPRKAFKVKAPSSFEEPVIYTWLDFSQIELRGAAEYTMQYNMTDVTFARAYIPYDCYSKEYGKYNKKEHKKVFKQVVWYVDEAMTQKWTPTDLHLAPVLAAFPEYKDIDLDSEDPELQETIKYIQSLRNAAKGINFGILYGSGLNGILSNPMLSDFSEEALTKIFNAQKETYLNLAAFQKLVINKIRKFGWVNNLQGRVYDQGFPKETDRYGNVVYGESFKIVNYLVQGEAAGVLKQCMIRVNKYIKENNLKSKMLVNIHDEIGYMVPVSEAHHIVEFQKIMQDIEWWDIDVVSDMEIAFTDWSEKIEVKDNEQILRLIEENKEILNNQKNM